MENREIMKNLLNELLKGFDKKIDEEKGLREEAEKGSSDFIYFNGRVDGVDAARYLVEKIFMETPDSTNPVLMTRDNPSGFKLEDLAEKLRCEIQEKSINVAGDKSIEAQTVVNNNAQIIGLLFQIEAIQRQSFVVMSQISPDTGATGTPRIGDK